jgi:hypothetical protein
MRGNLIIGMIAGSVIGAAAAMIAMPYVRPQIQRAVRKGRSVIDTHLNKMESGS